MTSMDCSTIVTSLVTSIGGTGVFILIVAFFGKRWLGSRIEEAIKHEYGKMLEEFKFSFRQREQAAAIAKLFSKWIKYNGLEDKLLKESEKRDHFEEINRLNWELAIWIPDEEIVKKINGKLANNNEEDIRSLILDVRSLVLGKKSDGINGTELTYFSVKN
ncbi:MAG: hypothetical protein V1882_03440 [Candidatus Omnitrophota bacterium]